MSTQKELDDILKTAIDDIADEFTRARKKYSLDHDDRREPFEWLYLIEEFLFRANEDGPGHGETASDAVVIRPRLVQIGALALSAISSIDRVYPEARTAKAAPKSA